MDKLAETIAVFFEKAPALVIIIMFLFLSLGILFLVLILVITNKLHIPGPLRVFFASAQKAFERGKEFFLLHDKRIRLTMEECERVIDSIMRLVTKLFYDVVAEETKTEDGALNHPESKAFKRLVLYALNNECKQYFKLRVRENHYHKKTEKEFAAYVDEQTEQLIEIMTENLDINYQPVLISHQELFAKAEPILPTIRSEVQRLFYAARAISVDVIQQGETILDAQGILDPVDREKELDRL